ncbi:MAG: type pilus assembly PilZ [Myxococcales bacterium]|nr:type pilus assembly PilZ [Myxococcales bacterium]
MSDQRQHPRYAIELDVEVIVDGVAVAGRTHDISRGGFCMLGRSPVAVPATGEVRLALVFSETEFSEHLSLPGSTVWCTPMKGQYQIGVKFSNLDAQSRGYLDLFIKFLDGGDEGEDETE